MNLKNRISELERKRGLDEDLSLCAVLHYTPSQIRVGGRVYEHIEDVPADLRKKHLPVGNVTAPDGRTGDVYAPDQENCNG